MKGRQAKYTIDPLHHAPTDPVREHERLVRLIERKNELIHDMEQLLRWPELHDRRRREILMRAAEQKQII